MGSPLRAYFEDVARFSHLAKERQSRSARSPEPLDPNAFRARLVEDNLAFVIKIAAEYRGKGLALEDLLAEGNVGLLEAARRFDPARGAKFITYAVWWIRKAILAALSDQIYQVRVPRYQVRKAKRIREGASRLATILGRAPSRDEVAAWLGSTPSTIEGILAARRPGPSLDEPAGPDGTPIVDLMPALEAVNPERDLLSREYDRLLASAIDSLSRRERDVIVMRFGLRGRKGRTLSEVGASMGLTRERIRQIEIHAKRKLRKIIESRTSPPRG